VTRAERSELLAQEFGKAVAGNHPPSSALARRLSSRGSSGDDDSMMPSSPQFQFATDCRFRRMADIDQAAPINLE